MMKINNLVLIVLMALTVMSCSKDEIVMGIPQEGNAIEFGTYTGRTPQTRGLEMTDAKLKIDHFGVLAYHTGGTWATEENRTYPNFMYNQKVTHNSTNWVYTPVKYWPTTKDYNVSFFAYAPYDDSETDKGIELSKNTTATIGTPKVTLTIADDASEMIDFVAAVAIDKVGSSDIGTDPAAVNFNFKHELSRVSFKARPSELLFVDGNALNQTYINIKSAKLNTVGTANFYKKATYTFPNKNDVEAADNFVGSWNYTGALKFSNYDINSILKTDGALAAVIKDKNGDENPFRYTLNGSGDENPIKGVMIWKDGVDNAVDLFGKTDATDNKYLFFIPAGETGLAEGAATVTFEYDIVTLDSKLAKGFSVTSATKTVNLPEGTLKQGIAYNYTFTFNVDQVVVTAEVAKWDTVNEGKVDVDYTHPN